MLWLWELLQQLCAAGSCFREIQVFSSGCSSTSASPSQGRLAQLWYQSLAPHGLTAVHEPGLLLACRPGLIILTELFPFRLFPNTEETQHLGGVLAEQTCLSEKW